MHSALTLERAWKVSVVLCPYLSAKEPQKHVGVGRVMTAGILYGRVVRMSNLFRRHTLNLNVDGSIPHASSLAIWISTAMYNLQRHQRPVAFISSLFGVGG